jgi:hypothetical protein
VDEREAIEKGGGKLQKVGDDALGIALTSHSDHFHGDKMLWLR